MLVERALSCGECSLAVELQQLDLELHRAHGRAPTARLLDTVGTVNN